MKTTLLRATFLSAMAASMGLVACMDQPSATGPSDQSTTGLLITTPSEEPLAGNLGTPMVAGLNAEESKEESDQGELKAEAAIGFTQPTSTTSPASRLTEETKETHPSQPVDSKLPPTGMVKPESQTPIQVIDAETLPIEATPVLVKPDPRLSPAPAKLAPAPIAAPLILPPKPDSTRRDTGAAASKSVAKPVGPAPTPEAGTTPPPPAAVAAPATGTSPAAASPPPSKESCKKGVSC
jgi:hypothetical protein